MCGVFGFVANGERGPRVASLQDMALVTQTRGYDAWGMAWIDSRGRLRMHKAVGPIEDGLDLLELLHDARAVIVHTRWATHGSAANNLNNHPHACDGGWIVHNGQVPHHRALVRDHGLLPVSECDSEVLGLLIEEADGTLVQRCQKAVRLAAVHDLVLLGIWRARRLLAVRAGKPLSISKTTEGVYVASLPRGMPGTPREVPDDTLLDLRPGECKSHPVQRPAAVDRLLLDSP